MFNHLYIMFFHWVCDFVLQTHWQATNKSKNNYALSLHVFTYSLGMLLPISVLYYLECGNIFYSILLGFYFSIISFIVHWITDYFTSRLNSFLYQKGDIHNFFVSIGADQFLHYSQLFITFNSLKQLI